MFIIHSNKQYIIPLPKQTQVKNQNTNMSEVNKKRTAPASTSDFAPRKKFDGGNGSKGTTGGKFSSNKKHPDVYGVTSNDTICDGITELQKLLPSLALRPESKKMIYICQPGTEKQKNMLTKVIHLSTGSRQSGGLKFMHPKDKFGESLNNYIPLVDEEANIVKEEFITKMVDLLYESKEQCFDEGGLKLLTLMGNGDEAQQKKIIRGSFKDKTFFMEGKPYEKKDKNNGDEKITVQGTPSLKTKIELDKVSLLPPINIIQAPANPNEPDIILYEHPTKYDGTYEKDEKVKADGIAKYNQKIEEMKEKWYKKDETGAIVYYDKETKLRPNRDAVWNLIPWNAKVISITDIVGMSTDGLSTSFVIRGNQYYITEMPERKEFVKREPGAPKASMFGNISKKPTVDVQLPEDFGSEHENENDHEVHVSDNTETQSNEAAVEDVATQQE